MPAVVVLASVLVTAVVLAADVVASAVGVCASDVAGADVAAPPEEPCGSLVAVAELDVPGVAGVVQAASASAATAKKPNRRDVLYIFSVLLDRIHWTEFIRNSHRLKATMSM